MLQSASLLNRTGIYYGFARVLPQDEDDPDLAALGEEGGEPSNSSGSGSHDTEEPEEINEYDDDPRDDEWEVDEDEFVLGASPITEGSGEQAQKDWADGRTALKPRQMSKSSSRSVRSVNTLLEKANTMNLERSSSAHSQSQTPGLATSNTNSGATALAPPPSIDAAPVKAPRLEEDTAPSPLSENHGRDFSNTSNASSLRRRKKRRVPITAIDQRIFPMVMSVGWNPFYKNTQKTAEVHVIHNFQADFYGLEMRVVVLGYIRPEFNYVSKEALVEDIEMDKRVAVNSLARNLYQDYATDPFLLARS